jgi:lysozyme
MINLLKLTEQLKVEEGLRLKPYVDTVGKITIGYGMNLTDRGITEVQAIDFLTQEIDEVMTELPPKIPFWDKLSEVRQRVLADMAFNMGVPTLLTFKRMLTYLKLNEYELAANEMLDSEWAEQVHGRAVKLAQMMRTGKDL